jgi:deoxycytidylate deaminase
MIIQSGIKRVVAPRSDNPRWQSDIELSMQLFGEAGVEVEFVD